MNEKYKTVLKVFVAGLLLDEKRAFVQAISAIGLIPILKSSDMLFNLAFGQLSFEEVDGLSTLNIFVNLDIDKIADLDFLVFDLFADAITDFLGLIYIVDSSLPETFHQIKKRIVDLKEREWYLHLLRNPIVIAVTNQNLPNSWDTASIKQILEIDSLNIPIIPCVATDKKSVANVLIALCEEVLREIEKEAET